MNLFGIFGVVLIVFTALANADNPTVEYKVFGNYYAMNNDWGDPNHRIKPTFGDGPEPEMKVTFNFNKSSEYGYPAICRGWHYKINPVPGDTLFPRQVSKMSKIPVTFDYQSGGTNVHGDFAYDIFFRRDANKGNPELEVMIWGDHNSWPYGLLNGSSVITVGGKTFDVWEGNNTGAGYYVYTFVRHNTVGVVKTVTTKGSLDLDVKPFLNWLQANKAKDGKYNNNMYMHVIETGFEVVNGQGWVSFTSSINAS